MATIAQTPAQLVNIKADDRLGLTVFFAVVLHSLIILGISFAQPEKKNPPEKLPGLEVTLVQSKTDKKVEEADFLAQATQEGGGNSDEQVRPTSAVEPLVATGQVGEVSQLTPQTVLPQQMEQSRMQIMTATQSERRVASEQDQPELPTEQMDEATAQLLMVNKEIARQSAEIDIMRQAYASRPKKKFLSAKTKEYKWASYEEGWRKKIERIGTLNFPDAARRSKLSGDVRASVTIRSDGSVKEVKITKYSGHKVLDDAVKRIVKMASPYEAFPQDLREEYDEVVIVRTWQFIAGGGSGKLTTRR
ncbi:energy transducer TonB [Kaarinaea lacus]